MGERPNFLFIITDQQRADHLGCYGNTVLRTPNVDALAARGARFERFYVASPVCMPNRATLLTGRMPTLHKVRMNGIPLHFDQVTFPQLLRASGYRTALIGKAHFQNMTDRAPMLTRRAADSLIRIAGFDEPTRNSVATAGYDQERRSRWRDPGHHIVTPYYGFDEVELCNDHGDKAFGDYERWATRREPRFDALRGAANAACDATPVLPQAWRTRVPEELYSTHYVAERATAWLEQHASSGTRKPFFLALSFPDPHHPFTPPGRYWNLYSPEDVTPPRTCRTPATSAPPHVRWLHAQHAAGSALRDSALAFAVSADEARVAMALTYGMIAMIDDRIGDVLRALTRAGVASNTVVVFTSDHGDLMGDHGLLLKAPIHYQGLIRVPFIWSEPGRQSGDTRDDLCGTLDIATTILQRAGIAPPQGMQGRNLFDRTTVPRLREPDSMLVEDETQGASLGFEEPIRMRTLVTRRWRLTLHRNQGWGELYDLENDPDENRNLWAQPDARENCNALVETLARKMMDLSDGSPLPTARA